MLSKKGAEVAASLFYRLARPGTAALSCNSFCASPRALDDCIPSTSYTSSSANNFHRYSTTSLAVENKEYEKIVSQLSSLESKLKQESRADGRLRLKFSEDQLPFTIPEHEVEPDLYSIDVHARPESGSGGNFCNWLRKTERTPGRVQSFPGQKQLLIHMSTRDAEKLVRVFGRHGCESRVVALRVMSASDPAKVLAVVRAKPQRVHMTSFKTGCVENVDFLFCPRNRIVNVDVPIKLVNDELAPGIKKGAWMHLVNRTVRYQAKGCSIPPFIELDVKHLDLGQNIQIRQLPIPPNTRIPVQNYDAVVVRCTTDVGND